MCLAPRPFLSKRHISSLSRQPLRVPVFSDEGFRFHRVSDRLWGLLHRAFDPDPDAGPAAGQTGRGSLPAPDPRPSVCAFRPAGASVLLSEPAAEPGDVRSDPGGGPRHPSASGTGNRSGVDGGSGVNRLRRRRTHGRPRAGRVPLPVRADSCRAPSQEYRHSLFREHA